MWSHLGSQNYTGSKPAKVIGSTKTSISFWISNHTFPQKNWSHHKCQQSKNITFSFSWHLLTLMHMPLLWQIYKCLSQRFPCSSTFYRNSFFQNLQRPNQKNTNFPSPAFQPRNLAASGFQPGGGKGFKNESYEAAAATLINTQGRGPRPRPRVGWSGKANTQPFHLNRLRLFRIPGGIFVEVPV